VEAMSGHTSSQELLKLIRDGRELSPNIVISYGGFNDIAYSLPYKQNKHDFEHFFFHQKFLGAMQAVDFTSINYGLPSKKDIATNWIDNERTMAAISHEFGAKFLGCLQARGEKIDNHFLNYVLLDECFNAARAQLPTYDYLVDFTDIMHKLDENPYVDGIHVTHLGNRTIAENIHKELLKRGWVN
jgi:lysophospholipase L1-like esterase